MASLAHISAIDVSRIFAGSNSAVMTGNTTAQHLSMINGHHGNPGGAVVAGFTYIRGVYVGDTLAGSDRAIMAARTSTQYLSVIHPGGRHPIKGVVAGITNWGRCNM